MITTTRLFCTEFSIHGHINKRKKKNLYFLESLTDNAFKNIKETYNIYRNTIYYLFSNEKLVYKCKWD